MFVRFSMNMGAVKEIQMYCTVSAILSESHDLAASIMLLPNHISSLLTSRHRKVSYILLYSREVGLFRCRGSFVFICTIIVFIGLHDCDKLIF